MAAFKNLWWMCKIEYVFTVVVSNMSNLYKLNSLKINGRRRIDYSLYSWWRLVLSRLQLIPLVSAGTHNTSWYPLLITFMTNRLPYFSLSLSLSHTLPVVAGDNVDADVGSTAGWRWGLTRRWPGRPPWRWWWRSRRRRRAACWTVSGQMAPGVSRFGSGSAPSSGWAPASGNEERWRGLTTPGWLQLESSPASWSGFEPHAGGKLPQYTWN